MGTHRGRNRAVADTLVGGQGAGADLAVDFHLAQGQVAIHFAGALRVGGETTDEGHLRVVHGERLHGTLAITASVLAECISGGELPRVEGQPGREGRLGRRGRGRGHAAVAGGLDFLGLDGGHAGEGEDCGGAESEESGFQGTEERVHGDTPW